VASPVVLTQDTKKQQPKSCNELESHQVLKEVINKLRNRQEMIVQKRQENPNLMSLQEMYLVVDPVTSYQEELLFELLPDSSRLHLHVYLVFRSLDHVPPLIRANLDGAVLCMDQTNLRNPTWCKQERELYKEKFASCDTLELVTC
jgi:hypothetical protein